jgi:hypothetical protein
MKLIGMFPLLALALLSAHCGGSKFKAGTAASTGSQPSLAFDETPLDISKLPNNVDTRDDGGPVPGTSTLVESPMDLSCEMTSEKTIRVGPGDKADIKVQNDARVVMNVKGRFCPTVSDNLTVLFVIDFSGSMGPNTPDPGSITFQPATGNDPRTTVGNVQSCGRLQAVEAILAKFKPGDNVNVGTVTFASNIVRSHTTAPVDADTFKSTRLAADSKLGNFCSYIPPGPDYANQDMAVNSPGVTGATNYAAAFNQAYDFLRNVKGRKAVYFITDGRPTAGGGDPVEAGRNAAAKLKTIENLFFNAFFLQNKQSGLQEDKQGFDNLVTTIGAPERVVRVDSAAQLAVEVGKDQAVSFDPAQISASLTVEPYEPEADLKVLSFAQDPANPKAWVFETQTFVLLGKEDDVYPHVVKVAAKAKDGTTHTSLVKILYQKSL